MEYTKEECVNIDKGVTLDPEVRRNIRAMIAGNLQEINRKDEEVVLNVNLYSKYFKRLFDIIVSFVALLVVLPINCILVVCTFFDVGSPIMFTQNRVGKDLRIFRMYKFRNMNNKKDQFGNLLPGKERVTKFGNFVRKTSLDELLNFWNILKGDMSLIGPRPLVPEYTEAMSERHKKRYLVRPGLECPMISKAEHGKTWADQFENDIWYVENISFRTDIKMTIALIYAVFNKKSSKLRASAVRGSFMGYELDGSSIDSLHVPTKYVDMIVEREKTKV